MGLVDAGGQGACNSLLLVLGGAFPEAVLQPMLDQPRLARGRFA
jgi:hypothetical protein